MAEHKAFNLETLSLAARHYVETKGLTIIERGEGQFCIEPTKDQDYMQCMNSIGELNNYFETCLKGFQPNPAVRFVFEKDGSLLIDFNRIAAVASNDMTQMAVNYEVYRTCGVSFATGLFRNPFLIGFRPSDEEVASGKYIELTDLDIEALCRAFDDFPLQFKEDFYYWGDGVRDFIVELTRVRKYMGGGHDAT